MSKTALRVLGIDTSLRSTGLGVVEQNGSVLRAIAQETVKVPQRLPHSECLRRIHQAIAALVEKTGPEIAAIEGIFHCRNVRTAVTLGQARGTAIAACSLAGLTVYEYAPRRVKQAVCGSGAAHKEQVGKMVARILGLSAVPSEDEADALALAICHLNSLTSVQALSPDPI